MSVVAVMLILAVSCGLTWFFTQWRAAGQFTAEVLRSRAALDQVRREQDDLLAALTAENDRLRARNEMLVGLVGADAERAALNGSCPDGAGWL